MLGSAYAFEINSTTYSVESYFEGISGSTGQSTTYYIRQTGQYQATTPNISATTYEANIGVYAELPADISAPNISLVSPSSNATWSTGNTVLFSYIVSDDSPISYCSLVLNGIIVLNNTNITIGANSFSRVLVNGPYNWSVSCQDQYSNLGVSETYNLTVRVIPPSGGGGSTPISEPAEISREAESTSAPTKIIIPLSNTVKLLFLLLVVYSVWLFFIYKRDKEDKQRPKDLFVK